MSKKVRLYPKRRHRRVRARRSQRLIILVLAAILVILLVLAFLFSRVGRIPFFPNLGPINLAAGKAAHSSSYLTLTSSAAQAVDGNQNTTWESNHSLPASLTISLDRPYVINQVIVKLPTSFGAKTETLEVQGSLDNITFTRITTPKIYSISPTSVITINPVTYRYIRLIVSTNSQTNSAQIGEFEIYGVPPRLPWSIQSIDVMKFSKDMVCNPPSAALINTMTDRIASAGANMVAVSTPYDNPDCGSSVNLANAWINSARAKNLRIWHRHMGLTFEGIYGATKSADLVSYTKQIVDYINNNPNQFQDGDIFTPTPEPDSAGIAGVTFCPEAVCQFASADEYNSWIQTTQAAVKAVFASLKKQVKVGYYGHSSFIVWGEANPDWTGQSFLTQATVDSMDGVIAMDTYPDYYGGTMAGSLDGAHTKWPNAHLVVGEWGTVTSTTDDQKQARVNEAMTAAERPYIDGFNYWNLGPAGNESLLDASESALPAYQALKNFYTGLR